MILAYNHGVWNESSFPGSAGTVGIGDTPVEAFEDAIEQYCAAGNDEPESVEQAGRAWYGSIEEYVTDVIREEAGHEPDDEEIRLVMENGRYLHIHFYVTLHD